MMHHDINAAEKLKIISWKILEILNTELRAERHRGGVLIIRYTVYGILRSTPG
jgi:hypothetical protein